MKYNLSLSLLLKPLLVGIYITLAADLNVAQVQIQGPAANMEKLGKLNSCSCLGCFALNWAEEKWLVSLLEVWLGLACVLPRIKVVFCLQTFYFTFVMRFVNMSNGSKPCTMSNVQWGFVGGKPTFWSFDRLSVCCGFRNKGQYSSLSFWLLFIIPGKHYLEKQRLFIKCLL